MSNPWTTRAATLLLSTALLASAASAASSRWPGTEASISGAIAARIIAVKCNGPLTAAEISELDTYIDERQTAFMTGSKANQRFGEAVFPRLARDYEHSYSSPAACDFAARDMVRDMLARVRTAQTDLRKRAEARP